VPEAQYLRIRRRLDAFIEAPTWPEGVQLEPFSIARAPEIHALLTLAYASGGGSVSSFGEWWPSLSQDSEYDPDLCFPVSDNLRTVVGFAQCWTSGFVKDLVVRPSQQRREIGRALLLHVFRIFQDRGAQTVELKVETENPSGAIRFYKALGMLPISH
jgi:ribosomal protein S18 acetylase RimI-like enzyme